MPEQIALCFGEVEVGFENGEVVLLSTAQELFAPHTQFFATPAHHCAIEDGEGAIGDDQMLIDAHHLAEAFATRTSSHGRVEGEKIVGRVFKGDAIGLKSCGEMLQILFGIEAQQAFSIAFEECRFHRVGESRHPIFGSIYGKTVEEEE